MEILLFFLKLIAITMGILFIFICIPIKYKVLFNNKDGIHLDGSISFLYGMVTFRYLDFESYIQIMRYKPISLYRKKDKPHKKSNFKSHDINDNKKIVDVKETETTKGKMLDRVNIAYDKIKTCIEILNAYEYKVQFFETTKTYIKHVFQIIRFKKFEGNLAISLENPANTGQLAGIFSSIDPFIGDSFKLTTEFEFKNKIDGQVLASGRVSLIKLLIVTIIYIQKRPVRKLIKELKNKNNR